MDKQEVNEIGSNSSTMSLLGEFLKQKRIDKNFTLEKLSQKTKISINILKALEANDFDHLPSPAYVKGFVRSYVKVLGISQEEAINKMEYTYLNILGKPFPTLNHTQHMSTTSTRPKTSDENSPAPHELIESGDSLLKNTKNLLPIAIFAVVVFLFIGGYKIISSVVESEVGGHKEKDLGPKIESSSALVHHPEVIETVKVEESKSPDATAETKVEELKRDEVKPEPVFLRTFPTVDFKKIRGKLFTTKTDAPENENTSILPEQIKDSMNSNLQNIYIRATDGNTWLSYKIDNNPIESVIISKGNDLFLQGSEIRIFLGNVNVTKIFYNNYLIDTPTKSGVKSLIFPEESNSKYQLPLFPKAKDDILYTGEDYIKRMKLEDDEVEKRKNAQ